MPCVSQVITGFCPDAFVVNYVRTEDSMKKKIAAALLCLLCLCHLVGCSLFTKSYDYKAEENSIYVHADGQITASIIEDWDQEYYDLAELTGLAQRQVLEYNKTYYGVEYYSYDQMTKEQKAQMILPVCLDSIKEDKANGKVVLTLTYGNGDAFTGFNGIDIQNNGGTRAYTSTVGATVVPLEGTFVTATGKKSGQVQLLDEMKAKTDYYLMYVDFATTIYFEHSVEYVTNNVAVYAANKVQTQANQGSFILFK